MRSMRLAFFPLRFDFPLTRRHRDALFLLRLCPRQALSCLILPLPVRLNRFAAPLCVFIFGTFHSCWEGEESLRYSSSVVSSSFSRSSIGAFLTGARTIVMLRPSIFGMVSTSP